MQEIILMLACATAFVAFWRAAESYLTDIAEVEADAKYAEMYRNADIRCNIDIEIIDERS